MTSWNGTLANRTADKGLLLRRDQLVELATQRSNGQVTQVMRVESSRYVMHYTR